jgi:large subunit ribosomal protein L25
VERISLSAQKRDKMTKGGIRKLRLSGKVPAVLYGKKQEPVMLVVDVKDLERAVSTHAGLNALIDLKIDGGETATVLVRDYQAHPIDRDFTHVDFRAIDVTEKIVVEVPIELVGESIGVKEGGVLEQLLRKIEVRCLPTKIPERFTVNVENLKIGDSIHTGGLTLPEGVEFLKVVDYTIVTIVPPTKEEVPVPAPEAVEAAAAAAAEGAAAPAEGAAPAPEAAAGEKAKAAPAGEKAKPAGGEKAKKG